MIANGPLSRITCFRACAALTSRCIVLRAYSTTNLSNGINLAYDLHEPPATAARDAPPIVFIHGLFGSKKNNRSMSKYAP